MVVCKGAKNDDILGGRLAPSIVCVMKCEDKVQSNKSPRPPGKRGMEEKREK